MFSDSFTRKSKNFSFYGPVCQWLTRRSNHTCFDMLSIEESNIYKLFVPIYASPFKKYNNLSHKQRLFGIQYADRKTIPLTNTETTMQKKVLDHFSLSVYFFF